ncbi:MAG: hypothetical protein FJX75_22385 [Armatimonadetes bacterium]|nr:hypothetical protein [Armatimonadota bacterium]
MSAFAAAVGWMGVLAVCCPRRAEAWGGHELITRAAVATLPAEQQAFLAPEAHALASLYCTFPDLNWPNQGQWGGGDGDPAGARFPDTRREWGISAYCAWDPVLGVGKGYPHAPPGSYEASSVHFRRALAALREGKYEDGVRVCGVLLHYVQDSGSFPHLQPFHRSARLRGPEDAFLGDYQPQRLTDNPEQAPEKVAQRVRELVEFTEQKLVAALEGTGLTLDKAKALCAKELTPAELMRFVADLREEHPDRWQALVQDAGRESGRACADVLCTLLSLAPLQAPRAPEHASGANLAFNPSFEQDDGDGVPDGWVVGWLDLKDRVGRAEWYASGTHWGSNARTGRHCVLLLWAPGENGLEWRQTWPQAIKVRPGDRYDCSAWIRTRSAGGVAYLAVQVADTDYSEIAVVKSQPVSDAPAWQESHVEVRVPEGGKWLRVTLYSNMSEGAAWFDDVKVMKQG